MYIILLTFHEFCLACINLVNSAINVTDMISANGLSRHRHKFVVALILQWNFRQRIITAYFKYNKKMISI